jgi:DNA-binding LacI/PurR family transcriptional regulator
MVLEYLSGLIDGGEHNQMLPSQAQLCRRFDVSVITVRNALDKLEKQGMIFRRQGKGCFIHKVCTGKYDTARIFLFLPSQADVNDEFSATIVSAARDEKCHLMFYNYHDENDINLIREIRNFNANAIIWIAPSVDKNRETIERLRQMDCHLLLFNRECNLPKVNYVTGDHVKDGYDVATLLLKKEPKQILYVGIDRQADHSRMRYEGFRKALADNKYDCAKFCTVPVDCYNYKSGELTAPTVKQLKNISPDVIVCSQGAFLDDIYDAMQMVKFDLSGVRMADFNAIAPGHPLKNICHELVQPINYMGIEAIKQVKKLLNQEAKSVRLKIASEIIVKP